MNATKDKLYDIAQSQGGFFTAKQATLAGYSPKNFRYHVLRGNWKKEMRGIYHLVHFPLNDYWQHIVCYLWSHDAQGIPQGVFSHQTALELYNLSDVSAHQIHMTVPKEFRRFSTAPQLLQLHKHDLLKDESEYFHCFKITTARRTLLDIASSCSVARDHLKQAIVQAVARGLISKEFIQEQPVFRDLEPYMPEIFK